MDLESAAREAWRVVAADRSDATLVVADDVDTVAADPRLLRQLLENVLGNAVEHGGDDVTVRVDATDAGFAISDDGPGIPAAEREHVFERGVTTNADGTGLGLAIVADIAAAHDWTLALTESERGGLRLAVDLT
ncbi:MAG: sensor histidine kinase [Halarchaeum sp.]